MSATKKLSSIYFEDVLQSWLNILVPQVIEKFLLLHFSGKPRYMSEVPGSLVPESKLRDFRS